MGDAVGRPEPRRGRQPGGNDPTQAVAGEHDRFSRGVPARSRLRAGQGLTFTCHYSNTTDEPLEYGFGVQGEMCAILSWYAYPAAAPNGTPPSLGALVINENQPMPLIDTSEIDIPF